MQTKKIIFLLIIILFSESMYSQVWESVNGFPDINNHHAIGFSFNEKGYIVTGGDTSIATKKFFEYNSLTNTWIRKDDFPGERRSYAIGDFYNGKQYIGFGANFASTTNNIYLNDLWSYDPVNDTWEALAECPCAGRQHPSFNALNGKIYIGLGNDVTGDRDDFWAYDIETNSWSQMANFIGGKRHHPYHFTLGDYVYVGLGHNHVEHHVKKDWFRYDPQNDTWIQLNDLPAEGRVAGTQLYHDGYGYALSGQGEDLMNGFHHPMEEGEFWRYDPLADNWEELTPHPGESRYAPASFIIDDYVYIVSGFYNDTEQTPVMRIKLDDVNSTSNISNFDINIFPNPASDYINIFIGKKLITPNESIRIYTLDGRLVSSQINLGGTTIDISDLKGGVYFLSTIIDDILYKKQFTKVGN